MAKAKVGLILPGELDNLQVFHNKVERPVTTLFGDPGCPIVDCTVGNVSCVYVYREGKTETATRKPPGKANHRGNVWALRENGCTHIIGITLDGSLSGDIKPGDIVVLDDLIDCTTARDRTFHDGEFMSPPGVMHVPMLPPFSEPLRRSIIDSANQAAVKVVPKGTVIVNEGPCYPTATEVANFKKCGAQLVNWSTSPEVILAKEASMFYVGLSVVCFNPEEKQNQNEMFRTAKSTKPCINELLRVAIDNIGNRNWEKEFEELKKELGLDDTTCTCKDDYFS